MEYKLIVIQGEEDIILERHITADEVISMMRPISVVTEVKKNSSPKNQKKTKTCKVCGESGHNSKTCPRATQKIDLETNEELPEGAMDKKQFLMIRKCKHDERPIEDVADSFHIDEHEIEVAYRCTSYDSYLALR